MRNRIRASAVFRVFGMVTCVLLVAEATDVSADSPNDPLFDEQWYHINTGSNPGVPGTPDADLDTPEAWDLTTGAVLVAAVDSGVEWFHPDLVENLWRNLGEDADGDGTVLEWDSGQGRYVFDPGDLNGVDDDGNGLVDDLIGWDFTDGDNDPVGEHGTYVNGVLAARGDNSLGIAGICPTCTFVAIRGSCRPEAIDYAVDLGATVINLSCVSSLTPGLVASLDYARDMGVLVVAASGNGELAVPNNVCSRPEVLCVTGSDSYDRSWQGSSTGPIVDVAAPADDVKTTQLGGGYRLIGGTSVATPMVAGVGALVRSVAPALTAPEVQSIITSSVDPLVSPSLYVGAGRVNAQKAVEAADTAETLGSHPVAVLDPTLFQMDGGLLEVFGTVLSPDLLDYVIEVGSGVYPLDFDGPSTGGTSEVSGGSLGTIPLVNLPDEPSQVRLTVRDVHGQTATATAALQTGVTLEAGWPLELGASVRSSPALADLDGDGVAEVIVATSDGWLHAHRADGSPVSGWPQFLNQSLTTSPTVADVDGDGAAEVFLQADEQSVWAFDGDGSQLDGWPIFHLDPTFTAPIADVDADGELELVVATRATNFFNLVLYEKDGTISPGNWPRYAFGLPAGAPATVDLSGDERLEIVVLSTMGTETRLEAFDSFGLDVWSTSLPAATYTSPVAGDLNDDGSAEIVVGDSQGRLHVFTASGAYVTGWPIDLSDLALNEPAIADLNGDGVPEIVVGKSDGQTLAMGYDGTFLEGWPSGHAGENLATPVSIANINLDAESEVMFGTTSRFFGLSHTGRLEAPFPLTSTGTIRSVPSVADIDLDGRVEIAFGTEDGRVYLFESPAGVMASFEWPTHRGNFARTGAYEPGASTTSVEEAPIRNFPSLSFQPNPSSGEGFLRFSLAVPGQVHVYVVDVLGRRVLSLDRNYRQAGDHEIVWSAEQWPSTAPAGVYLLRLEASGLTADHKIVVR